jgi:hypothetical protein
MRRADHPDRPVTLFEIVKRAVDIVDPDDDDPDMGQLEEVFEDADEPVTGIENLEERVALAIEGIDNEVESPAVSVAAATILYRPTAATSSTTIPTTCCGSPRERSGRATRPGRCATGSPTAASASSAKRLVDLLVGHRSRVAHRQQRACLPTP